MSFADASYQGSCDQTAQCASRLGYYAVCKEGRCECQVNYHYSVLDDRCIQNVGEKIALIIITIIIPTCTRRQNYF